MKTLLLLQIITTLALTPAVNYAYLPTSIPFYAYDGVDYTCAFYLPQTYFVAVEEEGREYDRVTYLDMSGYVKHGSAEKVDYEPVTKYATSGSVSLKHGIASVYLYADENCSVVLSPVTASDTLFLYGRASKEGVYYCRLIGSVGTVRGYVADDGVTVVMPNENIVEAVKPPAEEQPPFDYSPGPNANELNGVVEIILIVSLALPAFLLVFLFTGKKNKHK